MHTTQYQGQINIQGLEHHKKLSTIEETLEADLIWLKMELALDNHIRLGDGGESAVERVYFSRGQEALKFIFLQEQNFTSASHKARPFFSRCGSVPSPLPTDFPECIVTGPTSEGTCP